ncbi:MAG: hypothetical protein ACYC1Q_09195 [Bacteroidia bacterium]
MRKHLSFLLLLVILFNMTGIFIVFKVHQTQVRREIKHKIKAGIPESDLHSFSFSTEDYAQLDWERKDIEFQWNGEMYDIVKSGIITDSIHLLCVNDKQEKTLFAKLDELIQRKMEQESNQSNNPLRKLVNILKLVYTSDPIHTPSDPDPLRMAIRYADINPLYSSPQVETSTPPPDTL